MNAVNPLIAIFVVIILISINSFLASAEIALVSMNETSLKIKAEKGDKKAKHLLTMKQKPSDFLSTIQIGITLAGLLSGAFAADSLALLIIDRIAKTDISDALLSSARIAAVFIFTLVLTYFMMVFGELVPKRIAIIHPYKTGNFVISPIVIFSKIMKPFVRLMTLSTNGVLRILGIDPGQHARPVTEEEILLMMREGREQGTIEPAEEEIVSNLFEFTDLSVKDAMTHRTEIEAISIASTLEDVMELISRTSHGKFPVYEESIDNIVGIVYIKDIVKKHLTIEKNMSLSLIKEIMRRPFFISETYLLVKLFSEMKEHNNQLAIVVDEYGGTSGIITIMDILEEIVGDIEKPKYELIKISDDGGYIIDGRTEINEVSKYLDIDIDSEVNYTLSGFMIRKLGYVPSIGQTPEVKIDGYIFRVKEIYGSLIRSVYVKKIE